MEYWCRDLWSPVLIYLYLTGFTIITNVQYGLSSRCTEVTSSKLNTQVIIINNTWEPPNEPTSLWSIDISLSSTILSIGGTFTEYCLFSAELPPLAPARLGESASCDDVIKLVLNYHLNVLQVFRISLYNIEQYEEVHFSIAYSTTTSTNFFRG